MRIKVLGTQSPYYTLGHACPGFLISSGDTRIMLDCGSGSHARLELPDDLNGLNVILSHLHRDHYNDIYNLQYSSTVFHRQGRLEAPIDVYLPATPPDIVSDITGENNSYARYHIYKENSCLKLGEINVCFCPTDHTAETYAAKLTDGRHTVVYTADTSFSAFERLVRFAQGADLLICESSLLTEHGFPEISAHLTAAQAGKIAAAAGVKRLLLTHIWPEESPEKYTAEASEVFTDVRLAREGEIITL